MDSWNNWLIKNSRIDRCLDILNYTENNNLLYKKILKYKDKKILGIGSGRGIHEEILNFLGFKVIFTDNDKDVVKYFKKVNNEIKSSCFDILLESVKRDHVVLTDGLLEHFNDSDLQKMFSNLSKCKTQVHCIPIIGAKTKEYGNEIYRSHKRWLEIFELTYPNCKVEVYPISHCNIFYYIFRKVFSINKYSLLPFELDLSGTSIYIVTQGGK